MEEFVHIHRTWVIPQRSSKEMDRVLDRSVIVAVVSFDDDTIESVGDHIEWLVLIRRVW